MTCYNLLSSVPDGFGLASTSPTEKKLIPCSLPGCKTCSSDHTQCTACLPNHFYKQGESPILNCYTSQALIPAGFGFASSTPGEVQLKACSVAGCSDCKSLFSVCQTCLTTHYYKEAESPLQGCYATTADIPSGFGLATSTISEKRLESCSVTGCRSCKSLFSSCLACYSGLYYKNQSPITGCYTEPLIPSGWFKPVTGFALKPCGGAPFNFNAIDNECQFNLQYQFKDLTEVEDTKKLSLRFQMLLSYQTASGETVQVPIHGQDLQSFVETHFSLLVAPPGFTAYAVSYSGAEVTVQNEFYHKDQKFEFKLKDDNLKPTYGSMSTATLPGDLGTKKKLVPAANQPKDYTFQPGDPKQYEKPPRGLSDLGKDMSKTTQASGEVLAHFATLMSIFILISDMDFTGTIFKIIQIVNLFDKLRVMNVYADNPFGEFIRFLSQLFDLNFIQKNDYFEVSKPSYNQFYKTEISVVLDRKKPEKVVMMVIALVLWLVGKMLVGTLWRVDDSDFKKIEKWGFLVKKIMKVQTGIFLACVVDNMFVIAHQLSHQAVPSSLESPEFLLSYIASVVLLLFMTAYFVELFSGMVNIDREVAKAKWKELNGSNSDKKVQKSEFSKFQFLNLFA